MFGLRYKLFSEDTENKIQQIEDEFKKNKKF